MYFKQEIEKNVREERKERLLLTLDYICCSLIAIILLLYFIIR